jgi:ubiquinone/menaquinone biosynthesis C-methylase UbiE
MVHGEAPGKHRPHQVFSPSHAKHLDSWFRWLLYRPDRLAERYVHQGDRVLDFGCGPGFFTREFAKAVGETGLVIAVDLQEEMLQILREKLGPDGLLPRIRTHRCKPDSIDLSPELDGKIDAAFAIFVVHEVPDPERLFGELAALLVPGSFLFIAEPPFVVSKREFNATVARAEKAGLKLVEKKFYFVNWAAVLMKENSLEP